MTTFVTRVNKLWLIDGLLDGCVAIIWAGKTHFRCVLVYITILEPNKLKVSDKTPTAKRIQTILDFPFHKSENQFYVKIFFTPYHKLP